MKVLITGAAGFIGANLSASIANLCHEVLGVDNFSDFYSPDLKEARSVEFLKRNGLKLIALDLCDVEAVETLIKSYRPDTIIHLAAQPGIRTPIANSIRYIQNNLVAYSNLLQVAVVSETPNFLYASSSSVYGNSTNFPFAEDDFSIVPISIYGATKLSNEYLASAYTFGSNTKARGMRFFTVYGPWGRPDMAYFRLIEAALNGSIFTKFGTGDIKRDFTFIDDICELIEKLTIDLDSRPNGYSDVVNIGGGKPHSLNDLIDVISSNFDMNLKISQTEKNMNDTNYTKADLSKLISITGKHPEIDLEIGVEKTIKWASRPEIRSQMRAWVNSTS